MRDILVTGSSGYIGQHLIKLLSKSISCNLQGLDKKYLDNVNLIEKNILDLNIPIQKNYDTVIHLAASVNVGESVQDPIGYYINNVVGTLKVLENIKCKNFIFASTGAADQLTSPYGLSKKAAEEIVIQYCKNHDITYTIFRFYNVIGMDGISPTNPDGLFYALINASKTGTFNLYGNDYNTPDGTCIRDYVHVNEVCNALKLAVDNPSMTIENLGHGKGHSVSQIIDIFKRVNNVDFDINLKSRREGDIEISILNNVSKYMHSLYSIDELLKI